MDIKHHFVLWILTSQNIWLQKLRPRPTWKVCRHYVWCFNLCTQVVKCIDCIIVVNWEAVLWLSPPGSRSPLFRDGWCVITFVVHLNKDAGRNGKDIFVYVPFFLQVQRCWCCHYLAIIHPCIGQTRFSVLRSCGGGGWCLFPAAIRWEEAYTLYPEKVTSSSRRNTGTRNHAHTHCPLRAI